jgi:hypothetical protein
MNLSSAELEEAYASSQRIESAKHPGWQTAAPLIWIPGLALQSGGSVVKIALAGGMLVLVVVRICLVVRDMKTIPQDRALLDRMRREEPNLDDLLARKLIENHHPLFEGLIRRIGQRPILWRVDRFLSGKSWNEPQ